MYVLGADMAVLGGRMFSVSVCEICLVVQLDLNKDQLVLSKSVGDSTVLSKTVGEIRL